MLLYLAASIAIGFCVAPIAIAFDVSFSSALSRVLPYLLCLGAIGLLRWRRVFLLYDGIILVKILHSQRRIICRLRRWQALPHSLRWFIVCCHLSISIGSGGSPPWILAALTTWWPRRWIWNPLAKKIVSNIVSEEIRKSMMLLPSRTHFIFVAGTGTFFCGSMRFTYTSLAVLTPNWIL